MESRGGTDGDPKGQTHYFDPSPTVSSRPSRVELSLPDLRFELSVDRGVFSVGSVDAGTMELLKATGRKPVPLPAAGDLLDLGCGYGPIACAIAHRHPDRTVWAIDVNQRALELTAANASELGLTNVCARRPDDVPSDLNLAGLWSNPPIRVGKDALHDLLAEWMQLLSPTAVAHLVVHRHLGADSLAAWLVGEGWVVSRLGSKRGYRILTVAHS